MKLIPLTQGKFAKVDDEDFERTKARKWHYTKDGYAGGKHKKNNAWTSLAMHRFIIKTPPGMDTDHINGDRLDNRKKNLRVCTKSQNQMNRGAQSNNSSGFKGVSFHRTKKKFKAFICLNKKPFHLGYFSNPKSAHAAYICKAKQFHGEFARVS